MLAQNEQMDKEKDRTLEEKDFRHIDTLTLELISVNRKDTSLALAKALYHNDISYHTGLELFQYIKADMGTLQRTYDEMLTEEESNQEIDLSNILNMNGVEEKQAKKIETEIYETIQSPRKHGLIIGSMGDDTLIEIDPYERKVNYVTLKMVNGKDYSRKKQVINGYPTNVIVYDSPISDEPRKFQATWLSKISPRPWKIGPDIIEEIKGSLMDSGYVTATRLINDVLPSLFNTLIEKGLVELKTDIETPGFFHVPEKKEVVCIHYDLSGKPSKEEINDALKCFEDLAPWFQGHEDKVTSMFKYGLVSPFSYAKKQLGSWIPWPYLYGKARSGKTTLGQMVLYMWGTPGEDNDMTGSSFDSTAKVGNRISQNTFPIVVNEPGKAFQRISVTEMIKGAIERVVARGRHEKMRYRNIPSFASVIFTANYSVPEDDALIRRLFLMNFSHQEAKDPENIKQFEEEWQTQNHKKCKFNMLKAATQAVADEIINDPSLLQLDWKELADTLLTRLYVDADRTPPEWVFKWSKSETMEDLDEEHRESVRVFLLEKINKSYGQVKVYDEVTGKQVELDNYTTKVKTKAAFKEKIWSVLNERLIPWMLPTHHKDRDHVVFTIGFRKEVQKELQVCQTLKGISELMGWNYKLIKLGKPVKAIVIPLSEFMDFLYPGGPD